MNTPGTADDDDVPDALNEQLGPNEAQCRQLQQLRERREAGLVSPHDMDMGFLDQLVTAGGSLRRADLKHETGEQVVVLGYDDLQVLGSLTFEHVVLGEQTIDADALLPGGVFVLFPDELA
jgi:hypothetical protein